MPKLWKDTVEEHRRDVRNAILDAVWALTHERGVLAVTMGAVADRAGIGRATLYKYFGGVEELLLAAHTRHVHAHLAHLTALVTVERTGRAKLHVLLRAYADICFQRRRADPDLRAVVHPGGEQPPDAAHALSDLFVEALREAQADGHVRLDADVSELAAYCVHAVAAAEHAADEVAVDRLVQIIEAGLAP